MKGETFYVFYDKNDFVKCCGTARQLVADGRFKSIATVQQIASHIRAGRYGNANVVMLHDDSEEDD